MKRHLADPRSRLLRGFAGLFGLILSGTFFLMSAAPAQPAIVVDGNIDSGYGTLSPVSYTAEHKTWTGGQIGVVEASDAYYVVFQQDPLAKSNAYCSSKKNKVPGCYQAFSQLVGSDYISFTWTIGGKTVYVPVDILRSGSSYSGYIGAVGGGDGHDPTGINASALSGTSAMDYNLNVVKWNNFNSSPNFLGVTGTGYVYGSIVEVRIAKSTAGLPAGFPAGLDLTKATILAHDSPLAPMPPSPPDPAATVEQDCSYNGQSGAVITLTNLKGGSTALFTITKDGKTLDKDVPVSPGASVTKFYDMTAGETAEYSVSSPGMTTVTETLTNDCSKPSATVTQSCSYGGKSGAVITLTNSGADDALFTITKDGTTLDKDVLVSAGGSVTKFYDMAEDETATFAVTSGGKQLKSQSLTNDCQNPSNPSAEIAQTCSFNGQSGALITFKNTGGSDAVFSVYKGSNTNLIDTVTVPKGGTEQVVYAMAEDETSSFMVTAAHMQTVYMLITNDCQNPSNPSAEIAQSCSFAKQSGAVLTFKNTGGSAVTFTVLKNGTQIDTVPLAAGNQVVRTYDMVEDETSTYTVSANHMQTVSKSLTNNCVKGKQFTPLPNTGLAEGGFLVWGVVALAGALVLVGVTVGALRRER